MLALIWLRGLVARRPARIAATAVGVAVAVGLLASIGTFLSASKATMTQRAAARVSVDWQVETQPGADPTSVLAATRATHQVREALPVGYASTTGLQSITSGSTQSTGPGVVLGLPSGYRATFPGELRDLAGRGTGVLLAQQTAANLHAAPGDSVTIGRTGLAPFTVRVDGVVDLPQADSLFQKVGAPTSAQLAAPPDNVVLLPEAMWHEAFGVLATSRPDLVRIQVHGRLSHRLPNDPAAAYTVVTGAAHNLEARLAGAGLVGDNLGSTLSAARSDASYAQVLFLFLGVPGAVLAGLLTAAVAGAGAVRRRHDQALLRTRGATSRELLGLAMLEAAVVGVVGAGLGVGGALIIGAAEFGTASFGATTTATVAWCAAAGAVGVVIALLAVVLPAWRDARKATVSEARRIVGRPMAPWWARYGLDFVLLAASGAVFWLTSQNGYQLVLAPEGTPSISVSYWALAGPALLWVGAGLLAYRVADLVLARGRRSLRRFARPLAGRLDGTVAASMSRQRRLLAGALALVALTVAFAGSTAMFNATYRQQATVDARLTNGADVTVTEPPGTHVGPAGGGPLARISGVRSVEPVQHRFAYVGADLQDLFGVRPTTVVDATKIQDAYFQGGSARQFMGDLAAHPDNLLVSAETASTFQLHPHDRVTLRLQDQRTSQYVDVPFHYAGIVKEFPTAPRDSFLVANARYVAQRTGSDAVGSFLLDTGGSSPKAVAARVRARVGTRATVTDIQTSRAVVGSSLTAVDLSGLTRVELAFALVLAAASTGLVLALGLNERRRTFAIVSALGASPRQLGGFVWSEATFVTAGGLALGALGAWALAAMLVKVLTGVFDPPPAALAVPWGYLVAVAAVAVGAVALSAAAAIRVASRPAVSVLREL
ncbi:MAG TPA: FtsX-like permease family protein [Acidimicrobiia bacterium]|nr:FtsX-like permease family protein [Acidimicrobiia bacterium]